MISFARSAKDELCEIAVKNECCRQAMLYGMLQFSAVTDDGTIVQTTENENVVELYERLLIELIGGECDVEYYAQGCRIVISDRDTLFSVYSRFGDLGAFFSENLKCEHCLKHYFRGAFLASGSVNGPGASYHLEIESPCAVAIPCDLLSDIGITFRYSVRNGKGLYYLKDGESIEYFLHFIEARTAAFSLSDEKIMREIRRNINRQNNFELANRKKAIMAGGKYYNAAKALRDGSMLSSLPEDLRVTAELKLAHPDANMTELAEMHDPQITKSGLYHRLERILQAADTSKNK